jgi:imidazolonepropionase-like amidohydrolase
MRALVTTLLLAAAPAFAADDSVSVDAKLVALNHVRVIDGTGAAARPDQMLVIEGGKIRSIGPAGKPPPGAQVLDLAGASVIPGLVGMHDHLFMTVLFLGVPFWNEAVTSAPRLYLASGVTTIRTTGSMEPYTDLNLKRMIDEGKVPGPKIHATGPYLEGAPTIAPQMHELRDAEDARRTVEFWADQGATSFKAYMHITRAELKAAVETSHKRGLKITGHLCAVTYREAAEIGIDDLEHGFFAATDFVPDKKPDVCPDMDLESLAAIDPDGPAATGLIRSLVEHHVAITSTLAVFEGLRDPALPARVWRLLAPEAAATTLMIRNRMFASPQAAMHARAYAKDLALERAFVKAGGLLLAGADPTGGGGILAGLADQRQVELLVDAGFTSLEAIHIATENGARYLGEEKTIGTIAVGKQADLVVVRGDPSTKIADIENVELVFKDGVGHDPEKLIAPVRGRVGLQ